MLFSKYVRRHSPACRCFRKEQFMRLGTLILSGAIASFAVGGVAWTAERMPAAVKIHDGMLTDDKGMTLYIFDNDKTPDKSACNGNCLMNWPALKAEASDK